MSQRERDAFVEGSRLMCIALLGAWDRRKPVVEAEALRSYPDEPPAQSSADGGLRDALDEARHVLQMLAGFVDPECDLREWLPSMQTEREQIVRDAIAHATAALAAQPAAQTPAQVHTATCPRCFLSFTCTGPDETPAPPPEAPRRFWCADCRVGAMGEEEALAHHGATGHLVVGAGGGA
jgi:hypothetical protein